MSRSRPDSSAVSSDGVPYHPVPGGVRLALRLTPRAARTGLDGFAVDAEGRVALRVRLAAPPVEGAANAALIAFLADHLRLRRGDVRIASGEASRHKIVILSGDAPALLARLAEWTMPRR